MKLCKVCNQEFKPKVHNAVYCSSKCREERSRKSRMADPKARLSRLLDAARQRSVKKNLNFNIDINYLMSLYDGKCQVSGIPFSLSTERRNVKRNPYAPSIDRIVPELGYTEGNVRLVVYQLNVAISEFGLEQFEEFIKLYRGDSIL